MTNRIKAEALELNPESQLPDERWSAGTSADSDAVKVRMVAGTAGAAGLGLAGGGEGESDENVNSS